MLDWFLNTLLLPAKNKEKIILYEDLKTLCLLFMDGVQLSQGYRATARRQFAFYHSSLGVSGTHLINYFLPLSPQEFLVLI